MRLFGMGTLRRVVRRVTAFVFRSQHRRHRPVTYGGRQFSAPQLMTEAILPPRPGVYAIQMQNWWGTMKPLHFGTSDNLHEELMVEGHVGFVHWLTHGGAKRGLFISYLTEKELDTHLRLVEGSRLNRHHFPHRSHSLDEHLAHHRIHRSQRHHH